MAVEQDEFIPTRDTLLIRLKDWDDNESWKEFFDIYWRLIYRTAMKAGLSGPEAEDVVQETVIAVCRNIPEFEYNPEGSFKAWLKNQTTWRIRDHLRKQRVRQSAFAESRYGGLELDEIPDSASPDPSSDWDNDWEKNLLSVAMERVKTRVDAKTFQVFELHAIDGLPAEKVSMLLGVTRASVHLCKHRVTALLKRETRKLQKQTSRPLPLR